MRNVYISEFKNINNLYKTKIVDSHKVFKTFLCKNKSFLDH